MIGGVRNETRQGVVHCMSFKRKSTAQAIFIDDVSYLRILLREFPTTGSSTWRHDVEKSKGRSSVTEQGTTVYEKQFVMPLSVLIASSTYLISMEAKRPTPLKR